MKKHFTYSAQYWSTGWLFTSWIAYSFTKLSLLIHVVLDSLPALCIVMSKVVTLWCSYLEVAWYNKNRYISAT